MKTKLSLITIVLAVSMLFSACGSTSSTSQSTSSPAYTSGQSFGSSILGLYSQYKQSGTINFKDTNTLLQLMQLASSCNTIKENIKNKDFYGSFVKGAILGSQNNITQNNAGSIINSLTGIDFNSIINAATGTGTLSGNAENGVTNTLNSIFSLFGK